MSRDPFVDRPAERHVFVDPSGRRRGRVRHATRAAVVVFAAWAVALVVGVTGAPTLPALPGPLSARHLPPAPHAVTHPAVVRDRELTASADRLDRQ